MEEKIFSEETFVNLGFLPICKKFDKHNVYVLNREGFDGTQTGRNFFFQDNSLSSNVCLRSIFLLQTRCHKVPFSRTF